MNILNIISIVCFALCLLMFFYFKWYIKKRTVFSENDERRSEYNRLIAEIDRVTDRDLQLVEERIKQLNRILEDADKRIALYVKELEKSKTSETLYASLGKGIRDIFDTNEIFPEDTIKISEAAKTPAQLSAPPQPETRQSLSWQTVMNENVLKEIATQTDEEPASLTPPSRQQLRSHIDLLIDDGLSAQEIASKLGISVAEVNLALNLRRR